MKLGYIKPQGIYPHPHMLIMSSERLQNKKSIMKDTHGVDIKAIEHY